MSCLESISVVYKLSAGHHLILQQTITHIQTYHFVYTRSLLPALRPASISKMKSFFYIVASLFVIESTFVAAMPTPNPAFGCSGFFGGCRRPGPSRVAAPPPAPPPAPIAPIPVGASSAKNSNGFRPVI